jgi:hypothetical protein
MVDVTARVMAGLALAIALVLWLGCARAACGQGVCVASPCSVDAECDVRAGCHCVRGVEPMGRCG